MKKILYSLLLCITPLLVAEEKESSGLLNYIKQDVISFVNPKLSTLSLHDILLDLLVVGAGCTLANRMVTRTGISSDFARAVILTPFIISNEYFRNKYGEHPSTFSKNIAYILLYVLYKRAS